MKIERRFGFENINLKLFKFMMLIYLTKIRGNETFQKDIDDFKAEILNDKNNSNKMCGMIKCLIYIVLHILFDFLVLFIYNI